MIEFPSDAMQLFVVQPDRNLYPESKMKMIVRAPSRERAKVLATQGWMRDAGNPDNYVVTPITNPGDKIKFNITL